MTQIVTALISVLGSVIGTFAGVLTGSKLIAYRVEQLEKKVEKHNQVIDRVYKIERFDAVMEEEMKVANHRISDLEEYHK